MDPGAVQPQLPPPVGPGPFQPFIDPGAIQPPPIIPPPILPPPPPPVGGGCVNQWARMRLRDGRTIMMFVSFVGPRSVAGRAFVPGVGWLNHFAVDLDEVLEMSC
ncbi:hypothetical protein KH400_12855 [Desertibacillus haloalkaliphilus]|nr:hypothetical protein [Desertibacillus haloalkaliphilus]